MPTAGSENAKKIVARYRELRLEDGLTEPQAREALERDSTGTPEEVREILATSCLLDSWPVGWSERDWPKLARWMTFDDVTYWVSRVVDTTETNLLIATLLSSQSHLSPLLKSVGPAFHGIPVSGRFSAGKSRCAEALTYLACGAWFASATVAGLKAVRNKGPIVVGIDEGDEAERDNPGVKAYLLGCHDWNARQLKFSQPDRNGKRVPVTTDYGGPVFVTFRKRPW